MLIPSDTNVIEAIENLALPTYNVPEIEDITVVMPAVTTSDDSENNQFVATPVLDKIVGALDADN